MWEKVESLNLLAKNSKREKWVKEFKALRDVDGRPDKLIQEVVDYFIPRISPTMASEDEGFLPEVYCPATLRTKWTSILSGIARLKKREAEQKTQADDEDRKILFRAATEAAEREDFRLARDGRLYDRHKKLVPEGEEIQEGAPDEVMWYIRFLRGHITKQQVKDIIRIHNLK